MTGNQDTFHKTMNQGHSAAWDQDWNAAAKYYRAALEISPENPQALTSLALALLELQDVAGALTMYQRAAVAAPEDPVPVEKTARIYERLGKIDAAIKASLQAAETVKLLLGLPSSLHNNWMHIDLKDTDFLLHER